MNSFKIELDLAKTELKLQVWDELESLVSALEGASGGWEKYRPEERPEEMEKKELKKLTKSELIERHLLMQSAMNEELDGVGTLISETIHSIVEDYTTELLGLRARAENILNRISFVKLFG